MIEEQTVILYTAKDLQRIFKCGRKKSYQLMNADGFPSFRIDSSLYVEKEALERWIARCKGKTIITY